MNTATILFASALVLTATAASAQTPAAPTICQQQLADLSATWTALLPNPPPKPVVAQVQGRQAIPTPASTTTT